MGSGTKIQAKDITALRKQIKAAGYATSSDSVIPGMSAISAPILNKDGEVAAVLGLVDRSSNHLKEGSSAIKKLLDTVSRASADLGLITA